MDNRAVKMVSYLIRITVFLRFVYKPIFKATAHFSRSAF